MMVDIGKEKQPFRLKCTQVPLTFGANLASPVRRFIAPRVPLVTLGFLYWRSIIFLFLVATAFPNTARALKGRVTHHRRHRGGDVYGGLQPVAGSHLYMFAINTAGYKSLPISLLNGPGVSFDDSGKGYIVSDAGGGFDLTGLYESTCQSLGIGTNAVYLQALGGDAGEGSSNSAIDLVTALPLTCALEPYAGEVGINELTTVAAAWALVRYANPSNASDSSSPSFSANGANPRALVNAIAYANNLVSGYTGQVGSSAYSGSLTVPAATINTMGNILAECVNKGSSSTACTLLFADSISDDGTMPTDVFQAAINIALNPSNKVAELFGLFSVIPSSEIQFTPTLSSAPLSWGITYGVVTNSGVQQRQVTLNHSQVQNSDQINFPIAVSTNVNPLLTNTSNGGLVQSPNGYDILFTSDSAGQYMLDFEIDNYNPSTGIATFWIRIPQLSHTTDTPIYMWFGIPNISDSLENALGVWSNNYLSVYHFGSRGTLGLMDSAIAGYNLRGTAGVAPGLFGQAASFSGDSSMFLYHGNVTAYPSGSDPVTLEAWQQGEDSQGSDLIGYGDASLGQGINLEVYYHFGFGQYFYGGQFLGSYFLSAWGGSNWVQMVGVYGGGAVLSPPSQNYIWGQPYGDQATGGTPNNATTEMVIGTLPGQRNCCALTGNLDEVRVSSVARSADWIATEANNTASPTSFGSISPALLYPSSVLLSSSANPTAVGQTVILSATVMGQTANSAMIAPTGSVTFYDGTNNLGLGTLSTSGIAALSVSTFSVASHSITAVYAGDSNYVGSTSSPLTETVTDAYTSTISCVPSVIMSGENVTCAVRLQSGASSPVSLSVGGSPWTSATPDAMGGAVANAVLNEGTPGTYTVAYTYPGDPGIPAVSNSTQITVNAAGTQPSGNNIYCFVITDQSGDCFSLINQPVSSGYALNSNINAYNDSVNGLWSIGGSGYDKLNRLTYAKVTPINGSAQWGCWAYDSFGNMLTQGISSQAFTNQTTCQAQSGAVTLQNFLNYDPNTNRISTTTSSTWLDSNRNTHLGTPVYDAAGDMTNDLLNQYLYNPQGQLCAVQTGPGTYIGYVYDAEGHRVAKGNLPSMTCDPALVQVTTVYFIGPDGQAMTEMGNTGWVRTEVSAAGLHLATYKPDGVHYPLFDWLGTKRVTVNPNLALNNGVEETCTSWPFGDQLNCNTSLDASPGHFTGKERDTESGLDYFEARFYTSSIARWTAPDPSNWGIDFYYPQTWNHYAYVGNNPLSNTDPNGLWLKWTHDKIIDESFGGLSEEQRDILKASSKEVDTHQRQTDQFRHSMDNANGVLDPAYTDPVPARDRFVSDQLYKAKKAQAEWLAEGHTGICPGALAAFGNALHPITDEYSPAHDGFQTVKGIGYLWHIREGLAMLGAYRGRVKAAETAAQNLFFDIFGQAAGKEATTGKMTATIVIDPANLPIPD